MIDSKYVDVIVDNKSKNTDTIYTYKIPEKYKNEVQVGKRILVPFGFGNKKLEAIIINIKNESDLEESNIKYFTKIFDDKPILTKELIELGKWIKKRYLSTYFDVFKAIIPTGISYKVNRYIKLVSDKNIRNLRSENQRKIIEVLKTNKSLEINDLKKYNIKNLNENLNKLLDRGFIEINEKIETSVSKKTEKYVKITNNLNVLDAINKLGKRAPKQKNILNYIKLKNEVKIKEILLETNSSISSIKALENKKFVVIYDKEINREVVTKKINSYKKFKLTKEQEICISKINEGIIKRENNKFLIHGVTGSGKTEIYLQLIEDMIKKGKQSIVLVPEISLTPQTVERFIGRFGNKVAVFHSKLSPGERFDEWRKIKEGKVDIVVGARSAVFSPFKNLGLIIIDEEHETSYKSSMNPKYDTLEVAEKRCEIEDAILILGSATPSIKTYYRARKNEIKLLTLSYRVNNKEMPKVEIVDMKEELNKGNRSIFSEKLYKELKNSLLNNKQIMIFINRRGFSSFVSCRKCGFVVKCKNCDISMTYHKNNDLLRCHYCGLAAKLPKICPECGSKYIKHFGIGTQKVEELLKNEFPFAKIARMDVDTTSKKGSHEKILDDFKNKRIDILVGTQMITKGLDFPNVTLVGIIAADMSLNLPDYNSNERTFQLITQVSGRAGRGMHKGKVILQTYEPNHFSLQNAKNHDYINFYKNEIILRKEFNYPPFSNIINIIGISENKIKLEEDIKKNYEILINDLCKIIDNLKDNIFGPNSAPISRINKKYRYQILIKCSDEYLDFVKDIVYRNFILNYEKNNSIKYSIDINPNSIL